MQDWEQAVVLYVSICTQKKIIEKPLCNCGDIEDPFHFFFECNQYNLIRRDMFTCISAISNPNLNILLHGNDGLSEE